MAVHVRMVLGVVLLVGCENPVATAPDPANQFPPALQRAAFEVEVHTDGRARILAAAGLAPSGVPLIDAGSVYPEIGPVTVEATGETRPGWKRVSVAIGLHNIASAAVLVAPRFAVATPPDRLLIIPLESWAPPSDGDVAVENGTDVTVELPNQGAVRLAGDWAEAPQAFFSAPERCATVTLACRPYAMLSAPLAPGSATELQQMTFELESTVHTFRFRVVVAGTAR